MSQPAYVPGTVLSTLVLHILTQPYKVGTVNLPILQMRKQGLREAK